MTLARRSFLTGLAGVVCSPAIVRASSLMAVKPYVIGVDPAFNTAGEQWSDAVMLDRNGNPIFSYKILYHVVPPPTNPVHFGVNFSSMQVTT